MKEAATPSPTGRAERAVEYASGASWVSIPITAEALAFGYSQHAGQVTVAAAAKRWPNASSVC